jgi:hypothetical protein
MNPLGKCPHCTQMLTELNVAPYAAGTKGSQRPSFHAGVVSCPACSAILAVVPDPNAIAQDVQHRLTGKMPDR